MKTFLETVARICYEANRAYCHALGDRSAEMWLVAPNETKASIKEGIEALMKNLSLTAEQAHEGWAAFKVKNGWKYGPKKNPARKEHPCLMPYDKLPESEKLKDYIFRGIVLGILQFEKEVLK